MIFPQTSHFDDLQKQKGKRLPCGVFPFGWSCFLEYATRKAPKRRLRRMKRGGFEEVSRLPRRDSGREAADTTVSAEEYAASSNQPAAKFQKETPSFRMVFLFGAGDEARTRYLDLGKVALYQMSYARKRKVDCSRKHAACQPCIFIFCKNAAVAARATA